MDVSTAQRHQDIMASQSLDSMLVCTKSQTQQEQAQEKKPRPAEQALHCPRCDSTNTKFCYYNNYSLSQPRYFCKSCRRYWTKGGTLRNVPVGGGCRKNRRCSSSSSSSSRRSTPDHLQNLMATPTSSSSQQSMISPLTSYEHHNYPSSTHHDLTLAFAHGNIPILGNHENTHFDLFGNHLNGNFLESLRGGLVHENGNSHSNNGLNLYYGLGNLGDVDNGRNHSVNVSHEDHPVGMHLDLLHHQNHQEIMSNASSGSSTPIIKQELGDNNRVLLNYLMTSGEIDTHRESCWNTGVLGSSWPHLVNSPLM